MPVAPAVGADGTYPILSLGPVHGGRGSDAGKAIERRGGEVRFGGHLADLKASV